MRARSFEMIQIHASQRSRPLPIIPLCEKKKKTIDRRLDPRPLTTQRAGLTHINEITLCRHHKVSKGALIHENKRFRVTS